MKYFRFLAMMFLTATLAFAACGGDDGETTPVSFTVTGTGGTAGDNQSFTKGALVFNMKYVPGGLTFPTGIGDDGIATVSDAYFIGETEVTYKLWQEVYAWATSGTGGATGEGQYSFENTGRQGGDSGADPVGTNQHPVTTINWHDAIVWCNALTEYYNANNGTDTDLDVVYYTDEDYQTPLRAATNDNTPPPHVSGEEDQPYIKASSNGNTGMSNCTAKGFRLLTGNEWELAARYRGTDQTNVVTGTIDVYDFSNPSQGVYYTKGNSASGATADYNDSNATELVSWYQGNNSSTKVVGTAGNDGGDACSGNANTLGLYDMSGDVREWNFDWHPDSIGYLRVLRGGGWNSASLYLRVGDWSDYNTYNKSDFVGFRFSRTQ